MKLVFLLSLLMTGTSMAAETSGEKLFVTNCSSCHGTDGKGQTDVGKAVKARNLITEPFKQAKDKNKVTEEDVLVTLTKGVPGTGMASFAHLPEADRKALAKYVLSLRSTKK